MEAGRERVRRDRRRTRARVATPYRAPTRGAPGFRSVPTTSPSGATPTPGNLAGRRRRRRGVGRRRRRPTAGHRGAPGARAGTIRHADPAARCERTGNLRGRWTRSDERPPLDRRGARDPGPSHQRWSADRFGNDAQLFARSRGERAERDRPLRPTAHHDLGPHHVQLAGRCSDGGVGRQAPGRGRASKCRVHPRRSQPRGQLDRRGLRRLRRLHRPTRRLLDGRHVRLSQHPRRPDLGFHGPVG